MKPLLCPTVVALFVRRPVAGRVKTRLARDLGAQAACELYHAMVADSIAQTVSSGMPLVLFHDGRAADLLPAAWTLAAERVCRQQGDSLGDRMAAAFERLFAAGADTVVLAGSDIPGIDADLLRSAAAAAANHDAVFAPALDGGYCLVAAKRDRFDRSIFEGIPWSTPSVLNMTLAACRAAGLSYGLLESRQDIDTLDDLSAYCRNPSATATATNAWLMSHGFLK